MSSHLSGATVRLSLLGKVSTLALKRGLKILLTNRSRHGCSVRPILTTNLKEEKFPQIKWFDLFFASLEPQKLHSSILFYFLLDCTDCFCENDTLPGKVIES